MIDDLIVGMAGSGGDGVVSAGESLLARGGGRGVPRHHDEELRLADSRRRVVVPGAPVAPSAVLNPGGALDVAVALNWDDFFKFGAELPLDAAHRRSSTTRRPAPRPSSSPAGGAVPTARWSPVPITELTKKPPAPTRPRPAWCWGCSSGWFGMPADAHRARGSRRSSTRKGEELFEANERAFQAGFEYAKAAPAQARAESIAARPTAKVPKLLTDGNDMCAAGAIFAGRAVLRRLPHHPVHRGDAVPHAGDVEVRRRGAAGRRRDRRHRRGAGRLVRGQEVDDRHLAARAWRSRPR